MKLYEMTTQERSLINMLVLNERARLEDLLKDVSPTKDYLFYKAILNEIRLCNETLDNLKTHREPYFKAVTEL